MMLGESARKDRRPSGRRSASLAILAGTVASVAGLLASVVPAAADQSPVSGRRDFQGVWKLERPTTTLEPISGPVPFTAEGRKQYDANLALRAQHKYDDYDITKSRCSSPGTPRLMLTPERFKIWQRQGVVTFDYEWNRAIRQIDMTGLPEQHDPFGSWLVPTMTGRSVGHWEGNTLVADTTNLSDRTLLDDVTPHSGDMEVVEHIRLVDPNTLEDRITIKDPSYFTRPWDAVIRYKRQPDVHFAEDVCLDRLPARGAMAVTK